MKRWVISDTHFFHENIRKYCNRPVSCDFTMIDYLVNMVKREDVLYHLGDVHFGTEADLKDILSAIKGRKYLVRGNHDRWTETKYLTCGFDGVFDALTVGQAYLTHTPSSPPEGMVNVHGHLHNLGYSGEPAFGEGFEKYHDNKHVLYAPELEEYRPVLLEKLLARAKGETQNAANKVFVSRRQRMQDRGLYGFMPHLEPVRGGEMPKHPYTQGGVSAEGMDWCSFHYTTPQWDQGIVLADYGGILLRT